MSTGSPWNIANIEGAKTVATVADINAVAQSTHNGLSQAKEEAVTEAVGEAVAAAAADADSKRWVKAPLAADTDLNTVTNSGLYYVSSFAVAATLTPALPVQASGILEVMPSGASTTAQRWTTTGAAGGANSSWQRERIAANTWTAWRRTDDNWEKRAISGATDLNTIIVGGVYWATSASAASGLLNVPVAAAGVLEVLTAGTVYLVQRWTTTGAAGLNNSAWQRERVTDTTWTAWRRTDEPIPATADGTCDAPGSGFKVIPLAVNLPGVGSTFSTVTEKSERHMMGWAAPVTRWRVHLRNGEYRTNTFFAGALSVTGMWFGEHDMTTAPTGNFKAAPDQVAGAFTTPADGGEWVSPWINKPMDAGKEYLISYGFTVAEGTTFAYHVGKSWSTATAANASATAGPGGSGLPILDMWIEAETHSTTPVIAVIGDSIAMGVGATWPVWESWLSVYARSKKALPVHFGGSGETMLNSLNASWAKWTRWAGLARPDSIICALGSNDVFGGATLAEMKTRHTDLGAILKANVSGNVYLATITPRNGVTGAQETVRRDYNTWLRTLPGIARDVFEASASVSTDDETLAAFADSSDGIHLSTAGSAAVAGTIVRPVTTPPVVYQAV